MQKMKNISIYYRLDWYDFYYGTIQIVSTPLVFGELEAGRSAGYDEEQILSFT